MSELVSIVIATYNRVEMLKKALDSAKNQTYKNLEIIVGDNHSTDETEEYMLEQSKLDSRIRYFRWEKNVGVYNNPNRMLEKVTGDYFLFLNDDDWLDLNYVEECIKFMQNNKGYAFVTPSVILYKEDYSFLKKCYVPDLDFQNCELRINKLLESYWISDVVTGFFIREVIDCMKNMDGYYFKSRLIEDVIFMIRALAVGKAKVITSAHYNKLNNGMSRDLKSIPKDYCDTTGVTKKNFLDKCAECFVNTIIEDEIFTLSIKDKIKYAQTLKPYIVTFWKRKNFVKRLVRLFNFLKIYKSVYAYEYS